jgi:hypothetical protein
MKPVNLFVHRVGEGIGLQGSDAHLTVEEAKELGHLRLSPPRTPQALELSASASESNEQLLSPTTIVFGSGLGEHNSMCVDFFSLVCLYS